MNESENCFTHDKLSMYFNSPVNGNTYCYIQGVKIFYEYIY